MVASNQFGLGTTVRPRNAGWDIGFLTDIDWSDQIAD